MTSTRHEFVLTASDRTNLAFASAKAGFTDMRNHAISATSAISASLGGIGLIAFTSEMASMGEQSLLAADRLNTSTEQISSLQYAASKFNVDGESMNAVLQDMSVRVQEFSEIGTGEAADFFETLGLDAKEFADLAPDELLYNIAKELDGISDASARVYLDQLGGDNLVSLLPALRNNAEGMRELQAEAYATNNVLKQTDAISLAAIANEINTMQNSAKSLSLQLASEFEPVVSVVSDAFNEFASDGEAVSKTLDAISTAGTVAASVYAGRLTTAFITSAQAKAADTLATRQNALANVEEAKATLAKAEMKLTTEKLAYQASIDAKKQDAIASEAAKSAELLRAKAAQTAAAADVEAATATKARTTQLNQLMVQTNSLQSVESNLTTSKARLEAATKRVAVAEKAHQAQIAKNAASIQVATDNTKKLDRAKADLERSTKTLTKAQAAQNATMRAGSIAARGLSGALGLVGGPIGLLFTGVTALSMLQSNASDATEEIELLGISTEELNDKLTSASYDNLSRSLEQVEEKIASSSEKIKALKAEKESSENGWKGRSNNVSVKALQSEINDKKALLELSESIRTEVEKRETRVAKVEAEARKQVVSLELRNRIEALEGSFQTAAQARSAAFEKELQDIQSAEDQKLITAVEASDLRFKSEQRFQLQSEQVELAQRQKSLSAFSENYTKREQLTLEHQQRVLAYMQENGITNDQDASVIAFQKESYDYQLQLFKDFQQDILKDTRDYGKSELQIEKDRYKEEMDALKKHLKDKNITKAEYDKAASAAATQTSETQKQIEADEFSARLASQQDFANLFVGMADSKNKELAAIGKAAAIYNIGLSTAEGVMDAWSTSMQLGPIAGPIVGGILSGAMIAYGAEQIGNINNQTYHTGGIAGQSSDNYSANLASNEVPAVLLRGEEVLTEQDPRHRNNLTLSKGSTEQNVQGSVFNTVTLGNITVMVGSENTANSESIGKDVGDQLTTQIVAVLSSKAGQKLVYSGVGAEAKRNGGKIKGVSKS